MRIQIHPPKDRQIFEQTLLKILAKKPLKGQHS